MTREEEKHALWVAYKNKPTIEKRNQLVQYYIPLTKTLASRIYHRINRCISFGDVLGYSYLELIGCVDRYKLSKKARFSTYLCARLPRAVINLVAHESGVSSATINRLSKMHRIIQEYQQDFGFEPDVETLAALMDVNVKTIRGYRFLDNMYLNRLPSGRAMGSSAPDACALMQRKELFSTLDLQYRTLNPLTKVEYEIAIMRVLDGMTFEEIGRHFGVTRQRSHSLWKGVKQKLQERVLKETSTQ